MRIRSVSGVLGVLWVSACGGGDGPSQPGVTTGSVQGTVVDQTNVPVAAATVTLSATGQTSRTSTTNSSGVYNFTGVAPGTYNAVVTPPTGFTIGGFSATTVTVVAGQQASAAALVLNKTSSGPPPLQAAVTMPGSIFSPQTVVIARTGTVTWSNTDAVIHNVSGGGVTVGDLAPGGQRSQTFAAAGTYDYRCNIHAGMTGTVIVQ